MEKRSPKLPLLHKEKIQSKCMRRLADALSCNDEADNNSRKSHVLEKGRHIQDIAGKQMTDINNLFRKQSTTQNQPKKTNKLGKNKQKLCLDEMSSDKQKLATRLDEICRENIIPSKSNQLDESNKQLLQLRAKAFIDQIYISGNSRSKQFPEAAEILRLNMDLFIKLLGDPYSLFLKKIRNLQFLPRSNNRKCFFLDSKSSEGQNCIKGKVKTHESEIPKGNAITCQSSNKTLAYMSKLKVKQSKEHQNLKSENQTIRATYLSFKDVKQTLKKAVGENKKKQTKNSSKDIDGRRGSSASAFLPNAKRRENKLKPVDLKGSNETTVSKKFTSVFTGNHKKKQLDISKETKQKLSHSHVGINSSSLQNEMSNNPKRIEFKSDIKACGSETTLEEANAVVPPGNTKILAMLYEPTRVDVANNEKITGCKESTKLTPAENRAYGSFLDPSSPLRIQKLEIGEDIEYKEGNTSPISVLEPFSSHEDRSLTRILSEPAKSPLQPCGFHFDGRKEILHLYVRNILQFSGMNIHELFVKGISLKNMMKSCPIDGLTRLAMKFNCDNKLLLDCIHEVMLGVYQNLPFLKADRLEEQFIDEVVKQVNFYLLPKTVEPPVDQLVGKDLAMSSSWIDLHSDTKHILIQVAEGVLLDSIVDTILEVQI